MRRSRRRRDSRQRTFKLLVPSIKGEDAKIVEHFASKLAQANPDPVAREMELAAIAKEHSDAQEQEKHLKAAEAASPQSPRVWNELFMFYLNAGRPDDAEPYVSKLASVDYDQAGGLMCEYLVARQPRRHRAGPGYFPPDDPGKARTTQQLGCQRTGRRGSGFLRRSDGRLHLRPRPPVQQHGRHLGLINCSYALHRPSDAEEYIRQGFKKHPQNPELRSKLLTTC